MKEIVINKCYGGFGLSHKAIMRYAELKGFELYCYTEKRDDKGRMIWGEFRECNPEKEDCYTVYYYKKELTEDELTNQKDTDKYFFYEMDLDRDDKTLVQVVKELGEDANGRHANLEVVEIPDDVKWCLEEYDGIEWVAEQHRTWG